jgi:hypothetical protein
LQDPDDMVEGFLRRYFPDLAEHIFGCLPAPFWSLRRASKAGRTAATGLPVANYPPMPEIRLNSVYWPTGAARWGFGLFLVDDQGADAVTALGGNLLTIQDSPLKTNGAEPSLTDGVGLQVNVLRPVRVTSLYGLMGAASKQWYSTSTDGLWILPVVDQRFYWQFLNTGNMALTCSSAWSDVFTQIQSQLGQTIKADTVASAYKKPDVAELTRRYENVALLFDAVSLSVGQRVVLNPQGNGVISSMNYQTAQSLQDNNPATDSTIDAGFIAGGPESYLNDGSDNGWDGQLPENVGLVCPKSWRDVAQPNGDVFQSSVPTSNVLDNDTPNVKAGTTKTFFTTFMADFSYNCGGTLPSTPNNAADINALLNEIADDYLNWTAVTFYGDQGYGGTRGQFNGIRNWTLTGYDDYVRWGVLKMPDGTYQDYTEVSPMPAGFGPEEQLSQDSFSASAEVQSYMTALGKVTTAIIKPQTTGTIALYKGTPGSETATNECVQAYNPFGALAVGQSVYVIAISYTSGCGTIAATNFYLIPIGQGPILAAYGGAGATDGLAQQATGVFDVMDDKLNTIAGFTLTARASFDMAETGAAVELWYDWYQSEWYAIPISVHQTRLGRYSGSSGSVGINAGATGQIELYDSHGNDQSLHLTNVYALATFATNETVELLYDYWQGQWYAKPLNRPLIGKVTTAITHGGNTGVVNVLDSKLNTVIATYTNKVWAPVVDLPVGTYVLIFWDYSPQIVNAGVIGQWWAVPMANPGPITGKYHNSGGTPILAGATGSIEVYDDQQNDLGFAVTALAYSEIVSGDWVVMNWDVTNSQWWALPMFRPLIGKGTSTSGTIEIYNAAGSDQGYSITGVDLPFGAVASGKFCLVFWDTFLQKWFAQPMATGIEAASITFTASTSSSTTATLGNLNQQGGSGSDFAITSNQLTGPAGWYVVNLCGQAKRDSFDAVDTSVGVSIAAGSAGFTGSAISGLGTLLNGTLVDSLRADANPSATGVMFHPTTTLALTITCANSTNSDTIDFAGSVSVLRFGP